MQAFVIQVVFPLVLGVVVALVFYGLTLALVGA